MVKASNLDFFATLKAFEDSQALLIKYENTKDPSLLPKIRSIKGDCQRAIDTWLKSLHSIDPNDPIRPVFLMGLSMIYRMLGGAHMYLSEYSDAKSCYASAIELGEELGQTSEIVQSINNLGLIALEQKNPTEAVRKFKEATNRLDKKTEREFGTTLRKNLKAAEFAVKR